MESRPSSLVPAPGPPPTPPGSLTTAQTAPAVLAYLDDLRGWSTALGQTLDSLDAASQVARDPAVFIREITLAMSLRSSIDARVAELVATWDSGRVGTEELARIGELIWSRLPDPFGKPSAFTFPEACILADAILARLVDLIATDTVTASGVAARIEPVRAAIERCRQQAAMVGTATDRIEALHAELEQALDGTDSEAITEVVTRVDTEITGIERDLIKEVGIRSGLAFELSALRRQYGELQVLEAAVRELADRCREKIADPPRLAVPDVTVIGEPPAAPSGTGADWAGSRAEAREYAERLDRVAGALEQARRAFAEPLQEREDLRGLLGAYRTRAFERGLAENVELAAQYRRAHDQLWSAPCDLVTARALVTDYQTAVRVALGAAHSDESPSRTRT